MSKPSLYIGIDPDVDRSGFAVWDGRAFTELTCLDLMDLFCAIRDYYSEQTILVRLEAGWLIKKRNWHYAGGDSAANDVGRNHEVGRQIEKYCIKLSIPYVLVKPLGYSSYTHQVFCALTRWPIKSRTNEDNRVAGMLVYGL